MNEQGPPADTDPRALGRWRRAKRALEAGYIHEISGGRNARAARRQHKLRTENPIEQPVGG